jgi:hypothetical protein
MAVPCYSGPNPVTDQERMVIWKWAKANGIDHGLPYDDIHKAINQEFFSGMARKEWIHDILAGRKTPLRRLPDDAWVKAANRRAIIAQAEEFHKTAGLGPIGGALRKIMKAPRWFSLGGGIHGFVFPVSHGGDLLMRPASWGTFFRGWLDVWSKPWSAAATERMVSDMRRNPLYRIALDSKLDVGVSSHPGDQGFKGKGLGPRQWEALKVMRFNLWDKAMQNHMKPGMSEADILDIGTHLAVWANHATGSAKGPIANLGGILFGPKLTQSKLNRMFGDPYTTIRTIANWNHASAGEKAVARQRVSGLIQYFVTGIGLLAANWGLNKALGKKDEENVNFTDPTKKDWLAFKADNFEFSIPGMHSEFKTMAQALATQFISSKQLFGKTRYEYLTDVLKNYMAAKLNPLAGRSFELVSGQTFMGRNVPWNPDPGHRTKKGGIGTTRLSWWEYMSEAGPIPLTGVIKNLYSHLRENGASATDAAGIVKGVIISGLMGLVGLHGSEDVKADKTPLRARHERGQLAR